MTWPGWRDDYSLTRADACGAVPDGHSPALSLQTTRGPEVVFMLDVPAGHALSARLETPIEHGALYLVEDCQFLDATCLSGVFTSEDIRPGQFVKELVWTNTRATAMQVFLIADGGSGWAGTGYVEISTGAVTCEPGEPACLDDDALGVCNGAGTSLNYERPCGFGCDDSIEPAACLEATNGLCRGAVDIAARGGSFSGVIDDYADNYDPDSMGCTGAPAPGPDAIFFVDADAGDVISASLVSDFNAHLWVTTDCTRAAERCVAGTSTGEGAREGLHFQAPDAGRYYIIVDSDDMEQRGLFHLDVVVELPMCPPGNVLGCLDETVLGYCGHLGAPLPYRCHGGCTMGVCHLPTGDICPDAVTVTDGDVVAGMFRGMNTLKPGGDIAGSCDFRDERAEYADGPIGPDTFYAVALLAGQTLHVTGDHDYEAAVFYIVEDCTQGSSCVENTHGAERPNLTYFAREDRTINVVAGSRAAQSSTAGYILEFNIFDGVCESGERRCSDAVTAQYCLPQGHWEDVTCATGCGGGGHCLLARGDTCGDAIRLESFDRVQGHFDGTNAMTPGNGARGACDFGWDPVGAGPGVDTFYFVELEAGQRLEVEVDAEIGAGSLVYLLGECPLVGTCLANSLPAGEHRLTYIAEEDEVIYIVVDRASVVDMAGALGFEVRVTVQDPGCVDGAVQCMSDSRTLGVCNEDGYFDTFPCSGFCQEGRCDEPGGLVCQDAIPITSGTKVSGTMANRHTLSLDLSASGTCEFADLLELYGASLEGSTTIYAVDVLAGQVLHAELDSSSERTFMYVFEDCVEGSNSCVARSDLGGFQEMQFEARETGTLYVVVTRNALGASSFSHYDLTVFTYWPGCTAHELSCLEDGVSLSVCGADGEVQPYRCDGACDGGTCTTPRGDVCADAIDLVAGDEVSGNFMGRNAVELGPGEVGRCDFPEDSTDGRDTMYRVFVPGGSVLSAELTTQHPSAQLYFLEDCGDRASCLVNTEGGSEVARHFAPEDQWVYVVVDTAGSIRSPEQFVLRVEHEEPTCELGEQRCGPEDGTIEVCTTYRVYSTHTCSSGVCEQGACTAASGEACHEPLMLADGESVTGTFGEENSVEFPAGTAGQCDISHLTRGPERVYAVDMLVGQNLAATIVAPDRNTLFHLIEDCSEAASCLAYGKTDDYELTLYHRADRDMRVHLVVDHRFTAGSSNPFELSVSVGESICTPGAMRCSASENLERCHSVGLWVPYTECIGGCADGRCSVPQGDLCADAVSVSPGSRVTADLSQGTRTLNHTSGIHGQCEFFADQLTADHLYRLEVPAGYVARARVETACEGIVLSMMEDCFRTESCLASGSWADGKQEIFFEASEAMTLHIAVHGDLFGSGSYELFVDVEAPSCVIEDYRRCTAENDDAEVCNGYGVWEQVPCTGGCVAGHCLIPTGDSCRDPIPVSSGDMHLGSWDGTNRLSPMLGATGECSFSAQAGLGPETFYAVELFSGEVLRAELESDLADGHVYLVKDCADIDSCLAQSATSGLKTLYYQADVDETIFLVVDKVAHSTSPETYRLRVDTQPAGSCTPGESVCADALELSYCSLRGIWEPYLCEGGCADDRCLAPRGDICADAVSIEDGAIVGDVFDGEFRPRIDPGTGTCYLSEDNAMPGVDRVFAIELGAGDILDATLTGAAFAISQTGMYVLSGCSEEARDVCLYGVPRTDRLEFFAPLSDTYYLVVDSPSATALPVVDLEVGVRQANAVCQPGASTCDTDTSELAICHDDGTGVSRLVTCAYGCLGHYCAPSPTPNDTCDTAVRIDGPIRLADSYGRFTNQYDPGPTSCVDDRTAAPDAVYTVFLAAGESLSVRLQSDEGTEQPRLYLVTGCDTIADSCVVGSSSTTAVTELAFVSPESRDYFLIVDGRSGFYDQYFILDVDFDVAECIPGAQFCADQNALEVCDASSVWVPQTCPFGCNADVCLPAPNNVCASAVDATHGLDLLLHIDEYLHEYSSDSGPGVSCTGSDADGPDAVFYVDVEQNEVIRALMDPAQFEGVIWMTPTCGDGGACLAGAAAGEVGGLVEVDFIAPWAGRYYIIADSIIQAGEDLPIGDFRVRIEVSSPLCEVGSHVCFDNETLIHCADDGSRWLEYSCDGGCIENGCVSPRGDICPDAIDASGGGIFVGD
ncbi:MAG: hypothetical protein ACNA8W_07220, partial [Bradymonadaceae bacterium]